MVQAVEAVRQVPAGVLAGRAGGDAARYQRRLRWLSALRLANGEGEDDRSAAAASPRSDIAASLAAEREMLAEAGGIAALSATAAEVVRGIQQARERALRMQARLGEASVRRLLGSYDMAAALR